MRTRTVNIGSQGTNLTMLAPARGAEGGWGLYFHPRKSGSANERLGAYENGNPDVFCEFVTGHFYGGLKAEFYTLMGQVAYTTAGGAAPRTVAGYATGGGLAKVPEDGGIVGAFGTPVNPLMGFPSIESIATYRVTIFEAGETATPVMRNLKIPRTSIVNTISDFDVQQQLLNPVGIGPQVVSGFATYYPSSSTAYDVSMFDGLYASLTASAFTGGSSPTATAVLFSADLSGGGGQTFAQSAAAAVGNTSIVSAPGLAGTGVVSAVLTAQLPPAAQFLVELVGSPTNASVLFDVQGR